MRTPTPLSKNTYFLPSAGSAVFLRSICRALTALGWRIGPKREVLQYLKGRKRRLERLLCGRISPAPLNSPDFATLGPFWPRRGAPCRNTAVMPVFAPQAAVSQPPGRLRRRRRPQTRRQGCGRPTPLPARLSTRASTAGRFPPAPGRARRCSGARARATCHG